MVPAVEDFTQRQEQIERNQRVALTSMSSDDEDEYVFKGDRLLTAEQLRDALTVSASMLW
jgi:hypothetical protein